MTPRRIARLPADLINQIAAGEVIERPASVVKELVENALDAEATQVDVRFYGGGLEKIVVRDNGVGMDPEQALLSLERHATSKLHSFADLHQLATMGFRGEALASIAAVSNLTLTTRPRGAEMAVAIEVAAGKIVSQKNVGAPIGTQIVVEKLLQNIPVRLKFLKTEATESSHIVEAVLRLALAYPETHFRLFSGERNVIELPPHASGLERARMALARSSSRPLELHPASGEEEGIHVEAYLASPAESTAQARSTYLFVNRRFVRDRGLTQAVLSGYGELLERGRYPSCVVQVSIQGEAVDVNVHPQKLEVRFSSPQTVFSAVRRTLHRAIADAPWLNEPAGSAVARFGQSYRAPTLPTASVAGERWGMRNATVRDFTSRTGASSSSPAPARSLFSGRAASPPPAVAISTESQPAMEPAGDGTADLEDGFFSRLRYIGQLEAAYLLCEGDGELVVIDQHAAHERVQFERIRDSFRSRSVAAQTLLFPIAVELSLAQSMVIQEKQATLLQLGFDFTAQERSAELRSVPQGLDAARSGAIFVEILDELSNEEVKNSDQPDAIREPLDHVMATMACHSVVRAGDRMGEAEVAALLRSMDGVDFRTHCPHGRPVLVRLGIAELEHRFGRA